jgi:hypothetical protein
MSMTNHAVGLMLTASAFHIPITRFRRRRSDPKDTANLAQSLDRLTDKNQQLHKKNQKLVDEVAAVRSRLVGPDEAHSKVKAEKTTAKLRRGLSRAFGRP